MRKKRLLVGLLLFIGCYYNPPTYATSDPLHIFIIEQSRENVHSTILDVLDSNGFETIIESEYIIITKERIWKGSPIMICGRIETDRIVSLRMALKEVPPDRTQVVLSSRMKQDDKYCKSTGNLENKIREDILREIK